ncbi:hypothetical protein P175DRAFT_0211377 [Aspergillus ochraceoroseus IBT 24754]|uniref:Uncharacterized protein n=1 Tax=Aspergillus ochraceoroseus IBT 24754 TaxID=1392256 RepID=A0A2T5M0K2_9EURO|nr:uncharacterized protein P175DRAFT_0211377 [Aspergillus ochraceoroseus IBT 24754]PTU22061.1 hypothetical protein P175DRAFT_0211377 [Aspergillus ochraceoroseus IBT 24754]
MMQNKTTFRYDPVALVWLLCIPITHSWGIPANEKMTIQPGMLLHIKQYYYVECGVVNLSETKYRACQKPLIPGLASPGSLSTHVTFHSSHPASSYSVLTDWTSCSSQCQPASLGCGTAFGGFWNLEDYTYPGHYDLSSRQI